MELDATTLFTYNFQLLFTIFVTRFFVYPQNIISIYETIFFYS